MATSDSNDASDIFWPGYVDAISNLAINLLFVIAVMAIVVIGATLQINELLKRKDRAMADDVSFSVMETQKTLKGSGKAAPKSSTSAESQAQQAYSTGTTAKQTEAPNAGEGTLKSSAGQNQQRTTVTDPKQGVPSTTTSQSQSQSQAQQQQQQQQQKEQQQKEQQQKEQQQKQEEQIKELQKQLQQSQQQLRSTQAQLSEAKAALGKAQSASGSSPQKIEGEVGSETETGRVETVDASQKTPAPVGNNASLVVQGGVVVNFNPAVTQLSATEVHAVIEKMATFAPVATSKWRVTVVVPKGFSEALRLGYYRAGAVRNALLQNGVSGANIDMQVVESAQPSADNSRVVIRLAK